VKIIAHGIKDPAFAKKAILSGVDFLEIDVTKRILSSRFTIQHNFLKGAFGIGPILETLLTAEIKTRAFLDLKPISLSNTFAAKFTNLLIKHNVKNIKICGHEWKMISQICTESGALPYYTLKNKQSVIRFKKLMPHLKKPAGFSVKYNLIDEKFMKEFKRKSTEIWTWTVNDAKEAKRLSLLKVDGIISDNWKNLLKLR
jgi:glycerophosphoryl diester phosphodiesterase